MLWEAWVDLWTTKGETTLSEVEDDVQKQLAVGQKVSCGFVDLRKSCTKETLSYLTRLRDRWTPTVCSVISILGLRGTGAGWRQHIILVWCQYWCLVGLCVVKSSVYTVSE